MHNHYLASFNARHCLFPTGQVLPAARKIACKNHLLFDRQPRRSAIIIFMSNRGPRPRSGAWMCHFRNSAPNWLSSMSTTNWRGRVLFLLISRCGWSLIFGVFAVNLWGWGHLFSYKDVTGKTRVFCILNLFFIPFTRTIMFLPLFL